MHVCGTETDYEYQSGPIVGIWSLHPLPRKRTANEQMKGW
jgi:hypothetical protein